MKAGMVKVRRRIRMLTWAVLAAATSQIAIASTIGDVVETKAGKVSGEG
jgi:hypothetical protein